MREYPKYRKNHFIWHGIFILLSLYYTLFLILFCIAAHTVSDNSTLSDICLSLGVSNTAILLELPFITMYISIMLLYGILETILKRFPIVPPSFIYLYSIYQFHVYFDVCFKQNKSLLVLSNKLFLCLLFIPFCHKGSYFFIHHPVPHQKPPPLHMGQSYFFPALLQQPLLLTQLTFSVYFLHMLLLHVLRSLFHRQASYFFH